MLFTAKLIVVDICPIKHHELIVGRYDNVFGDLLEAIEVVDGIDDFGNGIPFRRIDFLRQINSGVIVEGPCKALVSLPHPVDLCLNIWYNWNERSDTKNLDAAGASGHADVPGRPAPLRSSGDDPSLNVCNSIERDKLLSSPHTLERGLDHGQSWQPFGILVRVLHELLPAPGQDRILTPLSFAWIGGKHDGSIGNLLDGNGYLTGVLSQSIGQNDIFVEHA